MKWSRNLTNESFDSQYEYLDDPLNGWQLATQDAYIRIYEV